MTRFAGKLRVADLSSPPILGVSNFVVRFLWNVGDTKIHFLTTAERSILTREEARDIWREYRKAGYEPTDTTPFDSDGAFFVRHSAKVAFEPDLRDDLTKAFDEACCTCKLNATMPPRNGQVCCVHPAE